MAPVKRQRRWETRPQRLPQQNPGRKIQLITSWRPHRAALKSSVDGNTEFAVRGFANVIGIRDPGSDRKLGAGRLLAIRRNEDDWPVSGECAGEQVGAREAVHVARNRQAEKVEHGRRHVDDGAALLVPWVGFYGVAIRDEETVRCTLVRAGKVWIAENSTDRLLDRVERLHAES